MSELKVFPSNLVSHWQKTCGYVPNVIELLYLKVIMAFHNLHVPVFLKLDKLDINTNSATFGLCDPVV